MTKKEKRINNKLKWRHKRYLKRLLKKNEQKTKKNS